MTDTEGMPKMHGEKVVKSDRESKNQIGGSFVQIVNSSGSIVQQSLPIVKIVKAMKSDTLFNNTNGTVVSEIRNNEKDTLKDKADNKVEKAKKEIGIETATRAVELEVDERAVDSEKICETPETDINRKFSQVNAEISDMILNDGAYEENENESAPTACINQKQIAEIKRESTEVDRKKGTVEEVLSEADNIIFGIEAYRQCVAMESQYGSLEAKVDSDSSDFGVVDNYRVEPEEDKVVENIDSRSLEVVNEVRNEGLEVDCISKNVDRVTDKENADINKDKAFDICVHNVNMQQSLSEVKILKSMKTDEDRSMTLVNNEEVTVISEKEKNEKGTVKDKADRKVEKAQKETISRCVGQDTDIETRNGAVKFGEDKQKFNAKVVYEQPETDVNREMSQIITGYSNLPFIEGSDVENEREIAPTAGYNLKDVEGVKGKRTEIYKDSRTAVDSMEAMDFNVVDNYRVESEEDEIVKHKEDKTVEIANEVEILGLEVDCTIKNIDMLTQLLDVEAEAGKDIRQIKSDKAYIEKKESGNVYLECKITPQASGVEGNGQNAEKDKQCEDLEEKVVTGNRKSEAGNQTVGRIVCQDRVHKENEPRSMGIEQEEVKGETQIERRDWGVPTKVNHSVSEVVSHTKNLDMKMDSGCLQKDGATKWQTFPTGSTKVKFVKRKLFPENYYDTGEVAMPPEEKHTAEIANDKALDICLDNVIHDLVKLNEKNMEHGETSINTASLNATLQPSVVLTRLETDPRYIEYIEKRSNSIYKKDPHCDQQNTDKDIEEESDLDEEIEDSSDCEESDSSISSCSSYEPDKDYITTSDDDFYEDFVKKFQTNNKKRPTVLCPLGCGRYLQNLPRHIKLSKFHQNQNDSIKERAKYIRNIFPETKKTPQSQRHLCTYCGSHQTNLKRHQERCSLKNPNYCIQFRYNQSAKKVLPTKFTQEEIDTFEHSTLVKSVKHYLRNSSATQDHTETDSVHARTYLTIILAAENPGNTAAISTITVDDIESITDERSLHILVNKTGAKMNLSAPVVKYIEMYVKYVRPLIPNKESRLLFMSENGTPLSPAQLSHSATAFYKKATDVDKKFNMNAIGDSVSDVVVNTTNDSHASDDEVRRIAYNENLIYFQNKL